MDSYYVLKERVRLGRRIRELRGMTQWRLSIETGILVHNISEIERGCYSTGIDNLIKISMALHVSLDFFLQVLK